MLNEEFALRTVGGVGRRQRSDGDNPVASPVQQQVSLEGGHVGVPSATLANGGS